MSSTRQSISIDEICKKAGLSTRRISDTICAAGKSIAAFSQIPTETGIINVFLFRVQSVNYNKNGTIDVTPLLHEDGKLIPGYLMAQMCYGIGSNGIPHRTFSDKIVTVQNYDQNRLNIDKFRGGLFQITDSSGMPPEIAKYLG